jgi:hypothetical protein
MEWLAEIAPSVTFVSVMTGLLVWIVNGFADI